MKTIIVVVLAVFGCLVLGIGIASPPVYEGKELLTTDEYEEFKLALAKEEVAIHSITVLSSNPILVEFAVSAPDGFNYGARKYAQMVMGIILGTVMLGLAGFVSTIQEPK